MGGPLQTHPFHLTQDQLTGVLFHPKDCGHSFAFSLAHTRCRAWLGLSTGTIFGPLVWAVGHDFRILEKQPRANSICNYCGTKGIETYIDIKRRLTPKSLQCAQNPTASRNAFHHLSETQNAGTQEMVLSRRAVKPLALCTLLATGFQKGYCMPSEQGWSFIFVLTQRVQATCSWLHQAPRPLATLLQVTGPAFAFEALEATPMGIDGKHGLPSQTCTHDITVSGLPACRRLA